MSRDHLHYQFELVQIARSVQLRNSCVARKTPKS